MKITNERKQEIAFANLVEDLLAEYGIIFLERIDNNNFIFTPLTRKDYKTIVENPELNFFQKQDEVCAKCVVWPKDIDWDEVEAGVPDRLYKAIMEKSFLEDNDRLASLIDEYRYDLNRVDEQMTCIISEAFPNYNIEEIDEWNMIKFCKIYTQAEWKLKNLRGIELLDIVDYLKDDNEEINEVNEEEYMNNNVQQTNNQSININKENNTNQAYINNNSNSNIRVGNRTMTQEEYAQYKAFREQHPEINWDADAMFTGYETETVDTVPVALRTRR